ncbi:4-hydroxybenzoate polyprenyltransferase, mitochondrial [Adelges cooleyi]|uniref:4-hydroxybenzoate polyprenyltransferase, mitochondrial n=1 Tax=Adelges cooleyi TaxID=133065 RepID=UPI00218013F0|nr:4-hydroxybenzoate polyprenyltransferase, mitochondrial [Adelges cooleyi]
MLYAFSKCVGTRLKLSSSHVYYKTLSTESRKTICGRRSSLSTDFALVRSCSINSKVLVAQQSKPVDQPKSVVMSTLRPYMELMRFSRPTGWLLLYWPCTWSIALASGAGDFPNWEMLGLFGLGAITMRGAGCTINDMWDRDIDKKVERTKNRPLVINSLTMFDAWVFLAGQLGISLIVLLQLNLYTIVVGASSLVLVTIYPLMKRVTYWPQFVLGLTFNWGALLGWSAIHSSIDLTACLPLYAAGVAWTLFYDTIYGLQDCKDDIKHNVKSTAVLFGTNSKMWLGSFAAMSLSSLMTCGLCTGQMWPYYMAVCVSGGHMWNQIKTLDINNPADCGEKFISNNHIGWIMFLGIMLSTLLKKPNNKEDDENVNNSD